MSVAAANARAHGSAIDAAAIAAALGGRQSGEGWSARCPAHNDGTPSLSISERNGRVYVHCHADCAQADVIAALRDRGLWPKSAQANDEGLVGPPDRVWEYHDAAGKVVRRTARWNLPADRGKAIRPQTPDGRGGWRTGEMRGPRPLYRLPDLLERHDAPVLVVEGEPAADAAAAMLTDYVVTTSAGGAKAASKTDWAPLRDRDVTMWPDADQAGAGYAADVARVAAVRVVSLPPTLRSGWDLADTFPAGWTVETVRELLSSAQPLAETSGARALDLAEFLSLEFPPRENLVDPVFPHQGLGMVHAWRGLGKTYFVTSFGLSVAAGAAFLKWKVGRPFNVLLVDGEMRGVDMQERLAKLIKGMNPKPDPAAFRIITPDLQKDGIPDLGTPEGQRWLEAEARRSDLTILDNLSSLLRSGTDKDDDLWLPLLDWLLRHRASGRSALLVHHDGKNETQRGTSRREDPLDTVFHLKKPHDYKQTDGARFVIHFEKHRGFYGPDAEPFEAALIENPNGGLEWSITELEDALTVQVAEMLKEQCTVTEIVKELKIGRATVDRHKRKAIEKGLLS